MWIDATLAPAHAHGAIATTAAMTSSASGRMRRARRIQKARREIRPDRSRSRTRTPVMTNPDTTKKASTPRKPPLGQPKRWKAITAATATARRPWMSARRWPAVVTPSGGADAAAVTTRRIASEPVPGQAAEPASRSSRYAFAARPPA